MRDEMQCQLRKNASLNKLAATAPLTTEPLQRQGSLDHCSGFPELPLRTSRLVACKYLIDLLILKGTRCQHKALYTILLPWLDGEYQGVLQWLVTGLSDLKWLSAYFFE